MGEFLKATAVDSTMYWCCALVRVCACWRVFICVYWGDPCSVLVSCRKGKRSALTDGHREHLQLFVYVPAGCHHLLQSQRCITTGHVTHHHQNIHIIYCFQPQQRVGFCKVLLDISWIFFIQSSYSAVCSDIWDGWTSRINYNGAWKLGIGGVLSLKATEKLI